MDARLRLIKCMLLRSFSHKKLSSKTKTRTKLNPKCTENTNKYSSKEFVIIIYDEGQGGGGATRTPMFILN